MRPTFDAADACAEAFPRLRSLHQPGPGMNAPVGAHFIVQWWTSGNRGAQEIHATLVVKVTDVTTTSGIGRTQTATLVHESGPVTDYQRVIWDLRAAVLGYAEVFDRYTGPAGNKRLLLPTMGDWTDRLRKCDDAVNTLTWAFPGAPVVGGSPPDGSGFALFSVGDLRPFIRFQPSVPGNGSFLPRGGTILYAIEVGETGTRKFSPTRSPLHLAGLSFKDDSPRQQQDRLFAMREFFRQNSVALREACTAP